MKRTLLSLIVLCLTLLGGAAHAQTVTLRTEPMATKCGVYFSVIGNVPPTSAALRWRVSGVGEYKSGQPCEEVAYNYLDAGSADTDPDEMAGMLFGLVPGQSYDVKVVLTGAGYPAESSVATFTCLNPDAPSESGGTLVVPSGTADPYQYAIDQGFVSATVKATNRNKAIVLRGGTYRTFLRNYYQSSPLYKDWGLWGDASGYLTVRSAAGESAVFDGSDPAFDSVTPVAFTGTLGSTTFVAGDGVFEVTPTTPVTAYTPYSFLYEYGGVADNPWRLVCVSTGERYSEAGVTISDGPAELKARTSEPAWIWYDGKIYFRPHPGHAGASCVPKVPRYSTPLTMGLSPTLDGDGLPPNGYVRFKDITFKYFGMLWDDNISYRQQGGMIVCNVRDVIFDGVTCIGTGNVIWGRGLGFPPATNITLRNCSLKEQGIMTGAAAIDWNHIKNGSLDMSWAQFPGHRVSVLSCSVGNVFNGISYGGSQALHPRSWDIDQCTFTDIGDDAIELENWSVGIAATRNVFHRVYKGISNAPIMAGPHWYARNVWLGRGEFAGRTGYYSQAFTKFGNNNGRDLGAKVYLHNTLINIQPSETRHATERLVGFSKSGASYNLKLVNNYVASEVMPVDLYIDGPMGYPTITNGNRYVTLFPGSVARTGLVGSGSLFVRNNSYPQSDGTLAQWRGFGRTGNAGAWASALANWQDGTITDGTAGNMPGYNAGSIGTLAWRRSYHTTTYVDSEGTTRANNWMHDPDSSLEVSVEPSTDFPLPYALHTVSDLSGVTPRPARAAQMKTGVRVMAEHADVTSANIAWDCGPAWSSYEEAGNPTVGAVPYVAASGPATTVPTRRARVGSSVVVTLTATSSAPGGVTGFSLISVSSPLGPPVGYILGSPQGLGTASASITVTFDVLVPGDYTVSGSASDANGTVAGSGTVRARRATSTVIVAG